MNWLISITGIISFENYKNYFGKLFGAKFEADLILCKSSSNIFKPRLLSTGLRPVFMPNDRNFSGHHVISMLEQPGTLYINIDLF